MADGEALRRRLLSEFQRDFPLVPRPYAVLAERLGVDEDAVIGALRELADEGTVSRVGAVFRPNTVGASTLAAVAAPAHRLEEVADLISAVPEVNHNYQREHAFNIWFVVAATDRARVEAVLAEIERATGLAVLDLPMVRDYHLDLGFELTH